MSDEIEVTPEMIEAARLVFGDWEPGPDSFGDLAAEMYRAMERERTEGIARECFRLAAERAAGVAARATARRQSALERRKKAKALRREGLTFREIGLRLGVTGSRARSLTLEGRRRRAPKTGSTGSLGMATPFAWPVDKSRI